MTEYSYTGAHGRNLVAAIPPETTDQPHGLSGALRGGSNSVRLAGHLHVFNSRDTVPATAEGTKTVIDSCPCGTEIRLTVARHVDVPIPSRDGSYPGLTEITLSFSWEMRPGANPPQ